jgi:hypothetical protein
MVFLTEKCLAKGAFMHFLFHLFYIKERHYMAGLTTLCAASVLSYLYLGNLFVFDFDKEYSLPSIYHYMLLLLCCYGFYQLMQVERAYDVWFYAFMYLLIDDMTTLHETAGWLLSKHVIPSEIWFFTKRAIGEIVYLAVVGGLLGVLMVKRFWSASRQVRLQFVIFTLLVVALGLFGVLADSIHEKACGTRDALCFALGVIEDGGETFVTILFIHQIKKLLPRTAH